MNATITPAMKSDFNSIVELITEMNELEGREVFQHISERALSLAVAYKQKYFGNVEETTTKEIQIAETPKKTRKPRAKKEETTEGIEPPAAPVKKPRAPRKKAVEPAVVEPDVTEPVTTEPIVVDMTTTTTTETPKKKTRAKKETPAEGEEPPAAPKKPRAPRKKKSRHDMSDDCFSEELQSFDVLREFVKDDEVRNNIKTSELKEEFREWVDAIPDEEWNKKAFKEDFISYVRQFLEYKYGPSN